MPVTQGGIFGAFLIPIFIENRGVILQTSLFHDIPILSSMSNSYQCSLECFGLDWAGRKAQESVEAESPLDTVAMGLAFSSLFQRMFGKEEKRILMVGLDAAGTLALCGFRAGSC